jgi:RHS repeat-associated protein
MILTFTCIQTTSAWAGDSNPEGQEVDGYYMFFHPFLIDPWLTLTHIDPIFVGGGEFRQYWKLLNLGGPMDINFTLIYAPDLPIRSPINDGRTQFPPGHTNDAFTTNTIIRIVEGEDRTTAGNPAYINVFLSDDGLVFKEDIIGNFMPIGPVKYQMKKIGNYYYLMDPIREKVYIFRSRLLNWDFGIQFIRRVGEVIYIMDRNNNTVTFTYNPGNNPTRIEDGLGRRLDLIHNTSSLGGDLIGVADGYGRTINFNFQQLACQGGVTRNVLNFFADALGHQTAFQYYNPSNNDCNLLNKIVNPLNNSHVDQTWILNPNNMDAISSQKDAYGHEATLGFDHDPQYNLIVTVNQPDGTKRIFHHESERYPLDVTDEANKKFTIGYNADKQVTSINDRLGDVTSIAYHAATGMIASITNAKGNTITYTYTAQDQNFTNPLSRSDQVTFRFYKVSRIDYPDGTYEQFVYDSKGNTTQWRDRAGKVWNYEYNSRGQVTKVTYPTGGTVEYTYNDADGTLTSIKDSDTGTTTYSYDAYKRLNRITHPNPTFIQIAYNLNDQITSITDENNHTYNYEYDANGNLMKITDPAGKQTQYAYDLMDRVTQVTNRLGKVTSYGYNNMNRIASTADPNGMVTNFGYDTRGWPNSIALGGQTWQTGYDDEGIVSSWKTPLNHTTTYQSDKLGFITGSTNPLNQTTTLTRDSMSRVTGVTDPLNRTINYSYDSLGLLSGVSMPVIGGATYARNDLGLLSQITDPNGSHWTFGYTNMGRLQSQTDPLGNTYQYGYDSRGRISTITYPGGGTATRTYDSAGNITRILYSDGPDIQNTFDSLNRLLTTNNLTLSRDDEGKIISTENPGVVFGATYDDGGRLKTVTYSDNAFTVTYTYDATSGLLSRVAESLTNTQIDFTYDNDRRLTGITRSNGINTTLTWDDAGSLTRIQDGPSTGSGFLDLQYTLDAAEQVTGVNMTAPLDPASFLTGGTDTFTYDAASQIRTSTWDSASRLVGIDSASATFAYNGLGDLVTRTESGKTIHYYYNYAIGLTPIVAEKDESTDQFLRYYVWTPGGKLLYMIDAANGNKVYFYHFDRTGSTLALTDSTGTVTDKYAYDPYGELLGHQGNNPQSFTFVGQWGVRQEGTGGVLYHMRARYYDAGTQRFISREPIWPMIADPRNINSYQYVLDNPVNRVDVNGLESFLVESAKSAWKSKEELRTLSDEDLRNELRNAIALRSTMYEDMAGMEGWMLELASYAGSQEALLNLVRLRQKQRMFDVQIKFIEEELHHRLRLAQRKTSDLRHSGSTFNLPKGDVQDEIIAVITQHIGLREAGKKVKGVWVGVPGMGRMFFPGAFIREGKIWNPREERWRTKSEFGSTESDTEIFREGLGPAEGFKQIY